IMGLQAAYANLHTDQERDYFMQRYHDVISSFGGKTSYDADNRPRPVDAKGEPLKATSYMAVGFYVAKYVNKKSDMDLAAKGLGAKEWNNSLKTKLSLLPKKLFRIRMSRNFGMKMLTMTNLSTECLIQLTKLGYDATPFNQIL